MSRGCLLARKEPWAGCQEVKVQVHSEGLGELISEPQWSLVHGENTIWLPEKA